MSSTSAPTQNFVQPSCAARDPRVAAAVKSVAMTSFAPLVSGDREMPVEATVRMLEDLNATEESRVLVVEPFSGYLPELLGRLAAEVAVVCADSSRAQELREQLADAGAANVRVQSFVQDREGDDRGFDRMVIMQPANEELGPVLQGLLAEHGRAIWSVDKTTPPRRLRRLLYAGSDVTLEEDLDLVHFMPLLGDMLVDRGVALRQEVAEAVALAKSSGRMLGQELLERGSVREVDLFAVLAEQQGFEYVAASDVLPRIDADLVRQLPRKYLDYYQFLPVCTADDKVWVVTPDVNLPVDEVRAVFDDAEVVCELICPTDLQRIWAVIELGLLGQPDNGDATNGTRPVSQLGTQVDSRGEQAAAGDDRFDNVMAAAMAAGASDVHFEPSADGARIRYRVHGRMLDAPGTLSAAELSAIASTVAGASGTTWVINGKPVDLLSRLHDTTAGPSVTVSVMADANQSLGVANLGLSTHVAAACQTALNESNGLILVSGPARSGRSTTVRAATHECYSDSTRKVVAVVGENVPPTASVATTQVNDGTDANVAAAVREALQHDADVLHVDAEFGRDTIGELIRAAHRGHLVVATAGGNDFHEALQGLVEAGVTNHSIASNVSAVMVQHLVRRTCSDCRVPTPGAAEQLAKLLPDAAIDTANLLEGAGCEQCNDTGVSGQVPVVEFVHNSAAMRSALRRGVAPHDLTAIARQNGLQSLRDSAIELLRRGEISLAEVGRVLTAEQREGAGGCSSTGTCS